MCHLGRFATGYTDIAEQNARSAASRVAMRAKPSKREVEANRLPRLALRIVSGRPIADLEMSSNVKEHKDGFQQGAARTEVVWTRNGTQQNTLPRGKRERGSEYNYRSANGVPCSSLANSDMPGSSSGLLVDRRYLQWIASSNAQKQNQPILPKRDTQTQHNPISRSDPHSTSTHGGCKAPRGKATALTAAPPGQWRAPCTARRRNQAQCVEGTIRQQGAATGSTEAKKGERRTNARRQRKARKDEFTASNVRSSNEEPMKARQETRDERKQEHALFQVLLAERDAARPVAQNQQRALHVVRQARAARQNETHHTHKVSQTRAGPYRARQRQAQECCKQTVRRGVRMQQGASINTDSQ